MSGSTYTVASAQPISIYPAGMQNSILIRNEDPTFHVFLSTDGSGQGFDLGPKSAIVWQAGHPLYASVLNGTSVMLSILDNAGALFDASAIASQISLNGAPTVDVNTVIYSARAQIGASGATFPAIGFPAPDGTFEIKTAQYQSVHVIIYEEQATNPATPVVRSTTMLWQVSGVGVNINEEAIQSIDERNSSLFVTTYLTSVKGGNLKLIVRGNAQTTTWVNVFVIGSYKAITKSRYYNSGSYGVANFYTDGSGNFTTKGALSTTLAANVDDYPPSLAGSCTMTVTVSSVATAVLIVDLLTVLAGAVIVAAKMVSLTFPISAAVQTQTITFNLGNLIPRLRYVGNGAVVTGLQVVLSYN